MENLNIEEVSVPEMENLYIEKTSVPVESQEKEGLKFVSTYTKGDIEASRHAKILDSKYTNSFKSMNSIAKILVTSVAILTLGGCGARCVAPVFFLNKPSGYGEYAKLNGNLEWDTEERIIREGDYRKESVDTHLDRTSKPLSQRYDDRDFGLGLDLGLYGDSNSTLASRRDSIMEAVVEKLKKYDSISEKIREDLASEMEALKKVVDAKTQESLEERAEEAERLDELKKNSPEYDAYDMNKEVAQRATSGVAKSGFYSTLATLGLWGLCALFKRQKLKFDVYRLNKKHRSKVRVRSAW